jgi:hypothetical protein
MSQHVRALRANTRPAPAQRGVIAANRRALGGSFLKLHGIYLGFNMELQHDGRTIVTTEVQSIRRAANDQIQ